MKPYIISLTMVMAAIVVGCAPTTRSSWEPTAWQVQGLGNDVPEVGTLKDGQFDYDIIVTDLRKVVKVYDPVLELPEVTKHPKTLIAVVVRCQNKSNGTLILDADPVQMINASQTLGKKLTREEVIFKLYGGRMREASQLGMLEELKKPIRTSSTFFGDILAANIAAQRADTRAFILDEMYQKEYTAYDIFHHSFEASSLPSGVSTDWVQYYHYSPGPIRIILQGQNVNDGLTFASPLNQVVGKKSKNLQRGMIIGISCVVGAFIFGFLLLEVS